MLFRSHTNMAAYGFIANAFIAGLLFAIPRLTRRPILSDALGWVIFGAWQLIMVLTIGGQLLGYGQAIEWGETPIFVDPLVMVGLVLLVINMAAPIVTTKEEGLYVSLWYFLAAFAWTGLVYFMGNYLPQFWVPGTGPEGGRLNIRNSRFQIIDWPDAQAILNRAPENPEGNRAVGSAG